MKLDDLKRFRAQLDALRLDIGEIKKQTARVREILEAELLIPDDAVLALIQALTSYSEKMACLQKTGKALSVSVGDSLKQIEEAILSAERHEQQMAEMELLLDYFRLTAEAANIREQLEESKRKLSALLQPGADICARELHPYKLAAALVRSQETQVTMDEFRELMDELGLEIAWTLKENVSGLAIEPDLDISVYISEKEVTPAQKKADEMGNGQKSSAQEEAEEDRISEKPETELPQNQTEKQETSEERGADETATSEEAEESAETNGFASRRWAAFTSYADVLEVSFTDTSAGTLGASKFINAAKNRPQMLSALFILANTKLIGIDNVNGGEDLAISEELRTFLVKQGYLMPVTVKLGDDIDTYLMLTSKGWACYRKADIVRFMKNYHKTVFVPESLRMTTDEYTAKNVLKLMLIHMYCQYCEASEGQSDAAYLAIGGDPEHPVHGIRGNHNAVLIPVVFDPGLEEQEMSGIAALINNWREQACFYLMVLNEADIPIIADAMQPLVDEDRRSKVFFLALADMDNLYDWNGDLAETNPENNHDHENHAEPNDSAESEEGEETIREEGTAPQPEPEFNSKEIPDDKEIHGQITAEEIPAAYVLTEQNDIAKEEGTPTSAKDGIAPSAGSMSSRADIEKRTEEMLAENQIYCASAYMAAAANTYPVLRSQYHALAYALNDPITKPRYSSQTVIEAFFSETGTAPDSWLIAAVLRNFFLDHIQYDYNIQSLYTTIKEINLYEISPKLKNVLRLLMEFKHKNGHGLDYYADYRVAGAASYDANLKDIQKEAELLYESYVEGKARENANNERFIATKRIVFARDGELATMLMFVVELAQKEAGFIKEYLASIFLKDESDFSLSNLDPSKMDEFINAAWSDSQDKLFYKRTNTPLVGRLRQNLIMKVRACLEVICRFVVLCDASGIDEDDKGAIDYKRVRKELLDSLDGSVAELRPQSTMSAREKADRNVILFALQEIRQKIDGTYQEEGKKYFYMPFLQNNCALLNESFLPELINVEGLPEMSSLACIERHFKTPKMSYISYAETILEGEDDYGSLSLILQYLQSHPGEAADMLDVIAEKAPEGQRVVLEGFPQKKKDFEEYLELAQSFGQIISTVEDKKETMLQSAGVWYEYALETRNYGFFDKIIEAFKTKISEDAKTRAVDLEKNLAAYKASNKSWESNPVVTAAVQKIEERIKVQNYSAAEDLLNRLQANDLEEHVPEFAKDYLEEFLRDYHDTARLAKTTGQLKIPLNEMTREGKAGRKLLQDWPKGRGTSAEKIRELLVDLGFNNPQVSAQKAIGSMDNYSVVLTRPANGRKTNYTHPISIFGSEAEESTSGFRVVCAFGRRKPEELIDRFKEIGNAKHTMMLLDYTLTLPERRTLARLSKKEYTGKTFVVVDRVVVAYLARNYSFTAINRMLMSIIVPFAYYQPYVAESARVMPPEIFMGRKAELSKIEDSEGVNIVYGGRQLGKSALLRMAQKDINWNENGDRAVLIDIKGLNYRETARKIAAELYDQHVLDTEIPQERADDWVELGREIKKVLRNGNKFGQIPYLLLLLDEADAFIEHCAEINYQPFDVLKDVQSVGTGRFKFVVAGLRNVVRFRRDAALSNNSVLTHLSALTVTPFKTSDAMELLQIPLHYLGFRFQNDSRTDMLISNILGTTNYFPGLLQLYCTKLIETMRRDYAGYNESETPPYLVREEHIKKVLADKTLEEQIREKFEITLKVGDDDYYYLIAVLVAFHYHNVKTQSGCSPQNVLDIASDYGISKIAAMSVEGVRALMEELLELNVLQKVGNGNYRFTRLSFCEMMGLPSDIDDKMMEYATAEGSE